MLAGHGGRATAAAFGPSDVLVTAAEDRTFRVWSCDTGQLLYQSCIESPAAFLAVAVSAAGRLTLGNRLLFLFIYLFIYLFLL